jgi:MraZ protein
MKMFLGEYNPNITEGSRIALPKKLREQILGDQVVLSRGFEKCVLVYDKNDWVEKAQKQVDNLQGFKTSDLERYLYTSAAETAVDAQGRVVLPANLKDFAQITKETAVIGVGDHIEIWDRISWQEHLEKITGDLSAQA